MKKREQQAPQELLWSTFTFAFAAFIAILFVIPSVPSFAGSDRYSYDEVNRLIPVEYENGVTVEYSYDDVGNRTLRQVTVPQIQIAASAGSGEIMGTVLIIMGYMTTYTYNAMDLVATMTDPRGAVTVRMGHGMRQ